MISRVIQNNGSGSGYRDGAMLSVHAQTCTITGQRGQGTRLAAAWLLTPESPSGRPPAPPSRHMASFLQYQFLPGVLPLRAETGWRVNGFPPGRMAGIQS